MDKYFYLNSQGQQVGPIAPSDFARNGVSEETMVWKQGMANWMRAGQIPELSQFFRPMTPPPPPGGNFGSAPMGNSVNATGGIGGSASVQSVKPDNNMVWAILSTLFCCLPTGVYAIYLASKVDSLYLSGQYAEAQAMANDAKKWVQISAGLGLVVFVIYFIIGFLGAMAS